MCDGVILLIVYADILIVLNLIVDYFLLLAVCKIVKCRVSLLRMLLGSVIGSVSSLYIFLPQSNFIIETLIRALVCGLMILTVFGFNSLKTFIKNSGILFLVTCGYGGIMIAIWFIFKPNGMVVNNSVVYFDISPFILITASVITYLLFVLFSAIFRKTASFAEKCEITVFADNSSINITGMVDTGNSIEDLFCSSEVIIVDKRCVKSLFGSTDVLNNEQLRLRYRLMPCGTVAGGSLLEGYRCDRAVIKDAEHTIKLNKPIIAVSKVSLNDDYSAIVNPRIFSR